MAGIVLVTGGSRGIGRGITRSLAAAGNDIIFTYQKNREAAEENKKFIEETYKVNCKHVQADFVEANEESVESCFKEIQSENYKGFVHNAGGYYHDFTGKPNLVDVQKYSSIYAHTFLMLMEQSKVFWEESKIEEKIVVGISSPGCNNNGTPYVSYLQPGVGKAGMEYLVRLYAKELRNMFGKGVRVNSVVPGYTKTEAWVPVLTSEVVTAGIEARMNSITSGGWIYPDEIGNVIKFLFSNAARSITGQVFNVDRGLHLQ